MPESTVAIKGVNDGLLITLDSVEEWGLVTADLAASIDAKGEFFNGAEVTLEVGGRPVRRDELGSIKALLERRGMTLFAVSSDSDTTLESAIALDLRVRANNQPQPGTAYEPEALPFNSEEDGTVGVMIRRTMRSGRRVSSQGHVVIYGDVNAGAEILAAGDVIIWGKLRGNVHAGADGDETAVVCALDMQPTQLRVAGYIAISPPEKRRKAKPEVALIRSGRIVVEDWDG